MQVTSSSRLEIPDSLRRKVLEFRRRVWTVKLIEAVAGGVIGIFVGYLLTYGLDRLFETPQAVRWLIFLAAVLTCGLIPLAIDRWVWRRRRLDQLARLLSHKHPGVGDQLLGIIELAESDAEQARSPALVEAAIRQVAASAEQRDFRDAVPEPKHRRRTWTAALLGGAALVLLVVTSAAARNAWARFLAPWSETPRYTFAHVEPLPETLVVAHGEPFSLTVALAESTEWTPSQAEVRLPGQPPVPASLDQESGARSQESAGSLPTTHDPLPTASTKAGAYRFELPGLLETTSVRVKVGDFTGRMRIEPMLRPELTGLAAEIELPAYLQRTEPVRKDVRGGTLTAVEGSRATFTATIARNLSAATVDGQPRPTQGATFSTEAIAITGERGGISALDSSSMWTPERKGPPIVGRTTLESGDSRPPLALNWRDEHGLSGEQPFQLTVHGIEDAPPSLVIEGLPRQRVLLDSEVIPFQIRARDDFGVKRVGIEWQGVDTTLANPAKGERIIGAGGPEAEFLELAATFSASRFGIEPQPVAVRLFVEDFHPDRERVYSPVSYFEILNPEDHAIWVTMQLSRWHRMSLEVRDRELQLHEVNKELRNLPAAELDDPATRRRIETQASAERTNARRLSNLVDAGENLLQQAMRNPEIGVGHLERWAEMMQILQDISSNRMPSVADLLKEAAMAEQVAQNSRENIAPQAGQNRLDQSGTGDPKEGDEDEKSSTQVPTITDIESSHDQPKPREGKPPSESSGSDPRLTLPTTMLAGNGSDDSPPPAGEKVDEAVREQQDLLAEFEKIADELNEILANLEGSTLVKRLKAASRRQQQVAGKLGSVVPAVFGASVGERAAQKETFDELAEVEDQSSLEVSHIMDDMAAYFERSRYMQFKVVLDDMREQDVTAGLRNLGQDLRKENGLSIAQAEYWSETLDRWAEDLVEVTKCGACPGCKSKGSLPPSIVLEVLQILEGEVNLREETRVAEQAREAVSATEHEEEAQRLSETQDELRDRVDKVVDRILELPDADADFGKEIRMLRLVSQVMDEARELLATPDTGSRAIAAETEAIELLLQSKRFNPNAGGGGGSDPGGGGGGDTNDSALALVGRGVNEKEVREDPGTPQSTGTTGPSLPEEFRSGLDEYFNRLEGGE
jgi:hypothetical protein